MNGSTIFFWSLRRRRLFEECRRRYYLTFHAAPAGADPDSPPELRELHRLATLQEADEYLLRLLTSELRAEFQEPPDAAGDPAEKLHRRLLKRFHREYRDMLFGRCEAVHRLPMLAELYRGDVPAGEFGRQFEQKLASAAFRCAPLVRRLAEIPPEFRRTPPAPATVHVNDLPCRTTLFLGWLEAGCLQLVDTALDEAGLLLHRFYALETLRIPPERVRSFRFALDTGALLPVDGALNLSRAMRQLITSAASIQNALEPDGEASSAAFPPAKNRCRFCPFEAFCVSSRFSGPELLR